MCHLELKCYIDLFLELTLYEIESPPIDQILSKMSHTTQVSIENDLCFWKKNEIAIIVMIDINQRLLPFFLSILKTGANRWDLE